VVGYSAAEVEGAMKVALDIDGTISEHPEFFAVLSVARFSSVSVLEFLYGFDFHEDTVSAVFLQSKLRRTLPGPRSERELPRHITLASERR
jgi:hypothetical protein